VTDLLVALLEDLAEETAVFDAMLDALGDDEWARPTPAPTWSVGDQVTHLAYFDDAATMAATDAETFAEQAVTLVREHAPDFPDWVAAQHRAMGVDAGRTWFREARARLLSAYGQVVSNARVPWYGQSMSAASLLTARLMETWAHGQDVAAALGARYPQTARLRHIAHLGVRTRAFSFAVRGAEAPGTPVRVELLGPDGSTWAWGAEEAADRVRGQALDFCLVVTQRRHVADTGLEVRGEAARSWMEVAQAFAGAPTVARPTPRRPPP